MRVCLIVSEIFAWGKYGGYGSMARQLAIGLKKRGIDVTVIVPRRSDQKSQEVLDGFTVLSYPGWEVLISNTFKIADADIYHSQEASLGTISALRAMPNRKHLITTIDPWGSRDWWVEFTYDLKHNLKRGFQYPFLWGYYSPLVVKSAVCSADAVYSQAKFLIPKVQEVYQLPKPPTFLPNPYRIPQQSHKKSTCPTVCYLARWDPRKRPEYFFELVKEFPKCNFIALGKAHNQNRDYQLRKKYGDMPNLELIGFIDPFKSENFHRILEKSWIMINTSAREGLPASYIEAAAHQCSILSAVDSDSFASRGGFHVKNNETEKSPIELGGEKTVVEDYAEGLEWLLDNNRWREKGRIGYRYVLEVHDENKVLDEHISIYEKLIED